jgi:hypothetical protein
MAEPNCSEGNMSATTREQFERAAQLAQRNDAYSIRWARIHQRMAEAAARLGR